MKLYKFEATQILPISLKDCWKFFSNPENLQKITPPEMDFEIKSKLPEAIYPGQIIIYKIKLFTGIKISWITEITQAKEEIYFIDEQRFGPYKFWHHQHIFTSVKNGVSVQDIVHYAVPFGIIGRLAHIAFIKRKLAKIFKYRKDFLEKHFHNPDKYSHDSN